MKAQQLIKDLQLLIEKGYDPDIFVSINSFFHGEEFHSGNSSIKVINQIEIEGEPEAALSVIMVTPHRKFKNENEAP